MSFSFDKLNLEAVKVSNGSGVLAPGRHLCKVVKGESGSTRSGGAQAIFTLQDENGGGQIRHFINVHVPSSQTATRIGREQYKTLAHFGGHPNPDMPGDPSSFVGLVVGVRVVSDTYMKDGEERTGSQVKAYFDPTEVGGKATPPMQQKSSDSGGDEQDDNLDDDIPF